MILISFDIFIGTNGDVIKSDYDSKCGIFKKNIQIIC